MAPLRTGTQAHVGQLACETIVKLCLGGKENMVFHCKCAARRQTRTQRAVGLPQFEEIAVKGVALIVTLNPVALRLPHHPAHDRGTKKAEGPPAHGAQHLFFPNAAPCSGADMGSLWVGFLPQAQHRVHLIEQNVPAVTPTGMKRIAVRAAAMRPAFAKRIEAGEKRPAIRTLFQGVVALRQNRLPHGQERTCRIRQGRHLHILIMGEGV